MLGSTIELPIWAVLVLATGCIYAILMSVLVPGIQWFFRRRLNRAIEKLNERLQIQIRPFQRTKRQVLIDRLIYDSQVIEEIEAHAAAEGISREALQARVFNYAREIVPAFNAVVYFRLGYWIAKKISRWIYRVRVGAADFEKLQAVDPDATVVFVMNHRSNMDYLLVTYLAANQVSLSYAVGEWARVFPLQTLIKALGGFFVRRASNDPLYRKVLERYVHMSTQEGVSQAVYLEGKLTQDGNLGEAKLGFLDYMLRNWNHETDRDIVFIPIGINYDHVLEDENLISTKAGSYDKGRWDHVKDVLKFIKINLFASPDEKLARYGYASVNFGIPISARSFCEQHDIQFRALTEKSERFTYINLLAGDLLQAIEHVLPVLPIPLISEVFRSSNSSSLRSIDVAGQVNQLVSKVIANGSAMTPEEKPKYQTISMSLKLLHERGILDLDDDQYSIAQIGKNLINYYANSIQHFSKNTQR